MRSFLRYWLPLLIWLGVIFIGSTNVMSAEQTSRFLVPFLLWLKPGMSARTIWIILVVMRKCAHVGEYAVLAVLLWRALRWGTTLAIGMAASCAIALLGCALFGASDEFHQTFVKSRTPSIGDVFLDTEGACLGLLIGATVVNRRHKNRRTCTQSQFVDAQV